MKLAIIKWIIRWLIKNHKYLLMEAVVGHGKHVHSNPKKKPPPMSEMELNYMKAMAPAPAWMIGNSFASRAGMSESAYRAEQDARDNPADNE